MRYFALLLIIGVVFSMLAGPQPIRPGVGDLPSNYRPDDRFGTLAIVTTPATGTPPRSGTTVSPSDNVPRPETGIPTGPGIGRGEIVTAPTHQSVSTAVESAR